MDSRLCGKDCNENKIGKAGIIKHRNTRVKADSKTKTSSRDKGDIWIISNCRNPATDLSGVEIVPDDGTLKAYEISDIAYYLLNPNPIEIKKRLIGCEIHYRQRRWVALKNAFSKLFPQRLRRVINADHLPPDVLITNCKLKIPPLKDSDLQAHLAKIYESLRSYDPATKRLPRLNLRKIAHIIGICEDVGGNLSYLKLQGGAEDKLKYLATNMSKDVAVVLRRACQADGLFELRGFDFGSYDAQKSNRLIFFLKNGSPKLCVLKADNQIAYWLDNDQPLKYLHLLEHSINANPNLKKAFTLCRTGKARAIKLFFNRKLEIDYSRSHFPKVYEDVLNACNVNSNQRNLVKNSLNYLQIGVSLNYVPLSDSGEDRLYTHISVLHDLRALESLRNNLPQVYSAISKGAFLSEAGRFYLLDSIEGHSYA